MREFNCFKVDGVKFLVIWLYMDFIRRIVDSSLQVAGKGENYNSVRNVWLNSWCGYAVWVTMRSAVQYSVEMR